MHRLAPVPLAAGSSRRRRYTVSGRSLPCFTGNPEFVSGQVVAPFNHSRFIHFSPSGCFAYDCLSDSWRLWFTFYAHLRGLNFSGFFIGADGFNGTVLVGTSRRAMLGIVYAGAPDQCASISTTFRTVRSLSCRVRGVARDDAECGYYLLDCDDVLRFLYDGGMCSDLGSCPYPTDFDPALLFVPSFGVLAFAGSYGLVIYRIHFCAETTLPDWAVVTLVGDPVPAFTASPSLCTLSGGRLLLKPGYTSSRVYVLAFRTDSVWTCTLSRVAFSPGSLAVTGGPDALAAMTSFISSIYPSLTKDIVFLLCTFFVGETIHCVTPYNHSAVYVSDLVAA